MKRLHLRKFVSLALALLLCLSLAACGGDGGNDKQAVPATIKDLPIDDSVQCDYSGFMGAWTGADGSVLLIEDYSGIRFELSDREDTLLASGNLQYVEEYSYVYAYNEHDGIAHQCWFDETNALHIDSFGTFTKVSGDVPGENIGDETDSTDGAALFGTWYQDGDTDGESYIDIDYTGTIWSLHERDADGQWTEIDYGSISAGSEEGQYNAASEKFDDVVYDFVLADENVLYWGGEYDNYQRV